MNNLFGYFIATLNNNIYIYRQTEEEQADIGTGTWLNLFKCYKHRDKLDIPCSRYNNSDILGAIIILSYF